TSVCWYKFPYRVRTRHTHSSFTQYRERRSTSPARTQRAKGTRYHRDPPNGTSSKSPTNSCIGPNSPVPTSRGVTETSTLAANDRTHRDRKSTRLNSSHVKISYAVFCL